MLDIRRAKKQYEGQIIIDVPSTHLDLGIFWLQGANGAGKTTLLRMIAGLLPFSGDLILENTSICSQPLAYRRKVSWAAAEPSYPGFLTGKELVLFYQHIRKAETAQIDGLIASFQLSPFLAAPIGSYSSGMAKKLSLLLAFIGNPRMVLLDEPLAMLDQGASELVPQLVAKYHRKFGTSFIFSSHQSFYADELTTDKKLLIRDHSLYIID